MSIRKHFHAFLPVTFFAAAALAATRMDTAIGNNLNNALGQLFFVRQPAPSHSRSAEAWLWTAIACFILGVIFSWRTFRRIKHARHTS